MTDLENALVPTLTALAEPIASSLGLEIWGIDAVPGGGLVRVYVESESGVVIDQCVDFSRMLGLALDVEDIIPGAYTLEVSSPGLERPFFTEAQLVGALGKRVEISLVFPLESLPRRRRIQGDLLDFKDGVFSLSAIDAAPAGEEPPVVSFSFSQLKKARQVLVLPEKGQPGKKKKEKAKDHKKKKAGESGDDDNK